MVESARPINSSLHHRAHFWSPSLNDMQYAIILIVDAFNYSCAIECARIARLTASRGIESRAMERHGGPAANVLSFICYARFKFDQMRIVVIETFGCRHVPLINSANLKDYATAGTDRYGLHTLTSCLPLRGVASPKG